MRWTYVIPRFIIIALICAFFAFAFDPLLRYSAVESVQAVTGAKADIPDFESGFFPPRLLLTNVALASRQKPGTNLMQFEDLTFRMAGDPLLRKCFVIEEAKMTGVRFGTSRSDNGQLEYVQEPDEPETPSWLSEKLKNLGDEWLEEFTAQAKAEMDPNNLESYRVGTELYVKWDNRFEQMNALLGQKKEQARLIREQIDTAKKAPTMQQVEIYLQLAQQADLLLREARSMRAQYQNIVPEVQQDFLRLDTARRNDQEHVMDTIRNLKPDARRISESLLGEQLYFQVQQMLSWLEVVQGYQENLKTPPPPERQRGRDFEFKIFNPTPKALCRKLLIDGELMLDQVPTPFEAVLTDVTSDPKMLGRPALLRMSTGGEMPMQMALQHDATADIAVTEFAAEFTDRREKQISVGKPEKHRLTASLNDTHWTAHMTLQEGQIQGKVDLQSNFGNPDFETSSKHATILADFTEQTLLSISQVNATVDITGPITRPRLSVTSDLGDQVASGFQLAFTSFVPQIKTLLTAKVDELVDAEREKLSTKFGGRYEQLLSDNGKIIEGLDEVRQLIASVKSGNVDPNQMIRTVSASGVLKENDQQKVNKVQSEVDKVKSDANKILDGLNDPNKALQQALPGLRKKLFK